MLVLLVLFTKTPLRPKAFAGAIAVTGGHCVWFSVAGVFGHEWAAVAGDVIFLFAGILWLWLRPGLGAVLFLGFIQLASLALNLYSLSLAAVGSDAHRALTAHCLLRVLAMVCLVVGYSRLKKSSREEEPAI